MSKGGQRRTLSAPCGWTTQCHPREANGKYNIHRRYCRSCYEAHIQLPEYNRTIAKNNGWKGIMPNGNKPKKLIVDIISDDITNTIVANESNIEHAIDTTYVLGITCKTCKYVLSPMTMEEHLDKNNIKNKCLCR